jgi:chitinase
MPGQSDLLFSDFTDLKKNNPNLKCIISLGGWSFTDPGNSQTVFSSLVNSTENQDLFFGNLFGFLREYAFDGIDIDWVSIPFPSHQV